jgi:hypothetical protein
VEFVEELGLSELTSDQIEELCAVAEQAARKYVLSMVSSKKIETLNIGAEAEGAKPVRLTVEVEITLSPLMKSFDVKKLAKEAVEEAFKSARSHLRDGLCHSPK